MKNRSTEQRGGNQALGRGRWFRLNFRKAGSLTWFSLLIIVCTFIFFPERPAWGGEFNLESGPNGIKGYTKHASLEEILNYLAYRNGYMIQIDQDLLDAPTTRAMAQAYTNYRTERNALNKRTQVAKLSSAKQVIEQKKARDRSGRTPALQETINNSNN